ncbi:MAG: TAT-variant-translocated molybdopterin oxidoreductase [Sorangiineae bacterium]|nr:TAT-variant-translocated molybdopterin oxidoreductase [Polyangiaceae bacterium]MEB2323086.1 TAT-variant-translocated molybdopterin oxidoreductase [Sorangiineae bacterium]
MSQVDRKAHKGAFWRSIDELERSPRFQELLKNEFAAPFEELEPNSPGRRRFMQVIGASLALAGVSGCRWQEDHLLPQTRRPAGTTPGVPRSFATAMELGGVATGLHVTSYDGRPIKVEGNPAHPGSHGACSAIHQASVLDVWDPDRSEGVCTFSGTQRTASSWKAFEDFATPLFAGLRSQAGKGLRILASESSSPSLAALRSKLAEAFPQAKWVEYEPVSQENEREGSRLAFGAPHRMLLDLEKADIVVSLDTDLLGLHPAALVHSRAIAKRRTPELGEMNRIYAIESVFTLLGVMADHRLALRSELVKAVAAALDAEVSKLVQPAAGFGPPQERPAAAFLEDAQVAKFIAVAAKDLVANRGKGVVVAGSHQPPEVHALAHRLNVILDNVGATVTYVADREPTRPTHVAALKSLVDEMNAGQVETLVVLGQNPVYSAPADFGFGAAYAKVKHRIHLCGYEDETSHASTWHLPEAHYLEAWGDALGWDGTVTMMQPLIAPIHGGRSALELVALISGDEKKVGAELVRRTHAERLSTDKAWRKAVHDGFIAGSAAPVVRPELRPLGKLTLSPRELGPKEVDNGNLELVILPDSRLYDGRFANNAWLQETPEPMTKLTWENAALLNPATAEKLGVGDSTLVKLEIGGKQLTMPAMMSPGQAKGSVRVVLGFGRTTLGHVGGLVEDGVEPTGVDVYQVRTSEALHIAGGLKVTPTGEYYQLGTTQDLHAIGDIGREGAAERIPELVRQADYAEYKAKPDFAKHKVEHPPLLSLWVAPVSYDGQKWGMSIDMNRCMGCNACMVACQAENNIPVVGKEQVVMGREMHWIRVDRYFRGLSDEPEAAFQPVPCQQCENAPCEQVCPVGATQHSEEGLNDMTYNRCIGTRYCSNNCPYKVRRFNFFNYHMEFKDGKNQMKAMSFNPEVSVRFRGVMEKCTYCVQRIQSVKIQAKNHKRPIKDGEIKTACQQTCPTEAIVFGDLNDKASEVAKLQAGPRAYALLEELNTRPRTLYLARVRNPHPELG